MGQRLITWTIGALFSLAFFSVLMSKLSTTGVQIPSLMARPNYVPETAVQRIAARIWFDCQKSEDGNPNHFEVTIYDGDTAQVRMREDIGFPTEIVAIGTYELSGPAVTPSELRHLFHFYDGEIIYLKNGEDLTQVFDMSSNW